MGKDVPRTIGDLARLFGLPVSVIRRILRFTPRRDSATAEELARGMVRALADRYTCCGRWPEFPRQFGRGPVDKQASMCDNRGLKTEKAGSLATVGSPRSSVAQGTITSRGPADFRDHRKATNEG